MRSARALPVWFLLLAAASAGSSPPMAEDGAAKTNEADERVYTLDDESGSFRVHLGKAGLFAFAGHEHEIEIPIYRGRVTLPASGRPDRVAVEVEIPAGEIRVLDPKLDEDERAEVQADMEETVLEVEEHPEIVFRSVGVRDMVMEGPGRGEAVLEGELSLHGVTREIAFPVAFEITETQVRARGELSNVHADYGLRRAKAAAGTVKVAKRIDLRFDVLARRDEDP